MCLLLLRFCSHTDSWCNGIYFISIITIWLGILKVSKHEAVELRIESLWVAQRSGLALICRIPFAQGCLSGTIILVLSKGKSSHILRFNEELFFIYLLPPIIFNAGWGQLSHEIFWNICDGFVICETSGWLDLLTFRFQVKKKQFFQNFLTIMLFGVVGVFISTFVITAGISLSNSLSILWTVYLQYSHLLCQKSRILISVQGLIFSTIGLGSWWLFPRLNFIGLTARDHLGEVFVFFFLHGK